MLIRFGFSHSLFPLLAGGYLFAVSSQGLLSHHGVVSSYQDASFIGLETTLMTSFNLDYLSKGLGLISRLHWELEFQNMNLRRTQPSIKQPLWFLFCVLSMCIIFLIPSSLVFYFHSCFLKVNISMCFSLSSSLFYTLFHFFIPMFLLW